MGEVRVKSNDEEFCRCSAGRTWFRPYRGCSHQPPRLSGRHRRIDVLLPEDEVGKFGLSRLSRGGRVIVTHADDCREELPVARGLEVSLLGRSMVTDCVIGPPLCEPLIGQLVLEELDLIVDCARNTLGPRPESPNLPLLKLI